MGIRAGLPESRNARVDQTRIDLRQRFVVDAETRLHVGPEILEQHVGALDELLQDRNALGFL
jgi:hypothetical protein